MGIESISLTGPAVSIVFLSPCALKYLFQGVNKPIAFNPLLGNNFILNVASILVCSLERAFGITEVFTSCVVTNLLFQALI